MGDNEYDDSSQQIKAFGSWDKASCLASLPTTIEELFIRHPPPPPSRFASYRAKQNGKSEFEFDRSVTLLVDTLRPYPTIPLEASEAIKQLYNKTYKRISRQRATIRRKMEDMRASEFRRHDNNEEASLDDDYDEGQEETSQGEQLDPDLALMFYDRHVQHTLQNNQQNAQFLLQLAGSPHFRRPHSGTRRPRQAETTPRRVRRRALFHDSPSAQNPTRVSTAQPMQHRNVSLQASQVAPTLASINEGETTGSANRSTNSAGLRGEIPDPPNRNVSTHVGDVMQQSAPQFDTQNMHGERENRSSSPISNAGAQNQQGGLTLSPLRRRRQIFRPCPPERRDFRSLGPDIVWPMQPQGNGDRVRAGDDHEADSRNGADQGGAQNLQGTRPNLPPGGQS